MGIGLADLPVRDLREANTAQSETHARTDVRRARAEGLSIDDILVFDICR